MKTVLNSLKTRAVPVAIGAGALVAGASPALADDPITTQLSTASVTSYLSSAQGIMLTAILILVGWGFLRRVFSK